jgi:light-harvesting protein B-800-850 alpha chain
MNNAKMWLVVKPSTGVPLFLGGVAVASLLVHLSVLTFAGWYGDYANGREIGSSTNGAAAQVEQAPKVAAYQLLSN